MKNLPFETTQIDLDSIMLGEVSHMEKDKYLMISSRGKGLTITVMGEDVTGL